MISKKVLRNITNQSVFKIISTNNSQKFNQYFTVSFWEKTSFGVHEYLQKSTTIQVRACTLRPT